MEFICKNCQQVFERQYLYSRDRIPTFCSSTCMGEFKHRNFEKTSKICTKCHKSQFVKEFESDVVRGDHTKVCKTCRKLAKKHRFKYKRIIPTKLDLAWTAGFIDGEGCIYVAKSKKSAMRHKIRFDLRLTVSQVDPRPLKRLVRLFGGNFRPNHSKNSNINDYYISNFEAIRCLKKIYPYLIEKKEEAKIALKFELLISTQLNNRISTKIFKAKESIYYKLRELKNTKYNRI